MEGRILFGTDPQAFHLAALAKRAGLVHGDVARGDLNNVCVGDVIFSDSMSVPEDAPIQPVFFCHMQDLRIRRKLANGSGGPIPENVEIRGLRVVNRGFVNIKNALIGLNGAFSITVDEATEIEPAETMLK